MGRALREQTVDFARKLVNRGERFRDVQVVGESVGELGVCGFRCGFRLGEKRISGGSGVQARKERVEFLQRGPGRSEGIRVEIELGAIVRAEQEIADLRTGPAFRREVAQRVEITERLRHLLPLDREVFAMEPVIDELAAVCGFALRDLVLVVREHVVDAAGVDVEGEPEVFAAHRGAFEVPAGAAGSPRTVPLHIAVVFVPGFPQGEIGHGVLGVLVAADAVADALIFEVELDQLPVVFAFLDGEVNGPVVGLVRVALVHQLLDHVQHFRDVRRGLGIVFRRFDAERAEILEERILVFAREGLKRQPRGARIADGLVVDVGQVHDLRDLDAVVFERAAEKVFEEIGAEIADVGVVVDRRAAGVHPGVSLADRGEFGHAASERVEKADHGSFSWFIAFRKTFLSFNILSSREDCKAYRKTCPDAGK